MPRDPARRSRLLLDRPRAASRARASPSPATTTVTTRSSPVTTTGTTPSRSRTTTADTVRTGPGTVGKATMTDHVVRLYALAVGVLAFCLAWATVAARPWAATEAAATTRDPRLVALDRRQARLARESARANRLVRRRWAIYRQRLEV